MNLDKIYKNIILADLLALILIIISGIVEGIYNENAYNNALTYLPKALLPESVLMVFGISIIIIYPITLFWLYRFNNFGKIIYLPLNIFFLFVTMLSGYIVSGPLLTSFSGLGYMLSGSLITIIYFTEIKNKFD